MGAGEELIENYELSLETPVAVNGGERQGLNQLFDSSELVQEVIGRDQRMADTIPLLRQIGVVDAHNRASMLFNQRKAHALRHALAERTSETAAGEDQPPVKDRAEDLRAYMEFRYRGE